MVYNKELKKHIPYEWKVESINDDCLIIDCLHSKKPELQYENENYFLLQLENLDNSGFINIKNKYYVSREMYELWTSKTCIKEGDVLITNAGRVGGMARVPKQIVAGIGRNITAVRPATIPPTYFYYYITSEDTSRQIKLNTDCGAFFNSFNVKGIKRLLLAIPNNTLLDDYEIIASSLRKQSESLFFENIKYNKLRDWLLPMLMNGQVEVTE